MQIFAYILILIMSVVIHEVSHGYVAQSLGDPTARLAGRLTLNPLKHLDWYGSVFVPFFVYVLTAGTAVFGWAKPVPYNPYNLQAGKWGPGLVAAAGPAANFVIAIIVGIVLRVAGDGLSEAFIQLAVITVVTNVMLGIFNLIPVPPLDGSKVLASILPFRWQGVEMWMSRYSLWILLFVIFFGWRLIQPPIFWLSGLILGTPLI